jgi:hypothetical protein
VIAENQTLLDILGQLKSAIEKEEWELAKKLDEFIKANIKDAVENAKSDTEKNDLQVLLAKIQSVYKNLITNTEESKVKLSLELKKITSDRKVANFYLKSSLYK